jgi:hypothetical protein
MGCCCILFRHKLKLPGYARHITDTQKRHGFRVHLDNHNEKLPAEIRDVQLVTDWIFPLIVEVGRRYAVILSSPAHAPHPVKLLLSPATPEGPPRRE